MAGLTVFEMTIVQDFKKLVMQKPEALEMLVRNAPTMLHAAITLGTAALLEHTKQKLAMMKLLEAIAGLAVQAKKEREEQ